MTVDSTDQVLSNWEELKKKEKHQDTQADAVDAVARTLPALWRAEKVKKKAAKTGFDWSDISGALDKLSEELDELKAAALNGDTVIAGLYFITGQLTLKIQSTKFGVSNLDQCRTLQSCTFEI